jgi:acyl transferase domain-containing protein
MTMEDEGADDPAAREPIAGMSGAIAHAIVDRAPESAARAPRPDAPSGERRFPLSGRAPESVSGAAARLADWLDAHPDVALDDVGHTLGERRDHLAVRIAVSAATRVELIDALRAAAAEPTSRQHASGVAIDAERTGTVFVFSGHGAQWNGMCRELLETEPVFAAELDTLADVFREELGYTPRDAIRHGEFGATERIQAMTFASQVALAVLWISKGIEPCAVIGYSTGEIAAAVVAGALDKQEAARFACRRARLYQRLSGQGGMVFVNLPFAEAGERLAMEANVVAAIAASPLSSVISGDAQDVGRIAAAWRGEGRVTRRVASDVAFHSPHVDRIIDDIRAASGTLHAQPPTLPMYNSTLGDPRAAAARDAAFWAANSRNPVRFEPAVRAALEDGFRFYLEVSTKPIVSHGLRETANTLGYEAVAICPTLRERQPERRQMLNSLAQLYCQGADVVWSRQFPSGRLADLPSTN